MARRVTKPILDTRTGREYRSEYAAGRELAGLVNGDPRDRFVWFAIARAFPDRFRTKNPNGDWVPLDDPSAPKGTLRDADAGAAVAPGAAGRRTRLTTVEIDEGKFAAVREVLETRTLRETVDRSFDDVLTRASRARSIRRLRTMEGLDLAKPDVMSKAWR